MSSPTIRSFGTHTVLITWEPQIDPIQHQKIISLEKAINQRYSVEILETVLTYHSIAIYLKNHGNAMHFIEVLSEELATLQHEINHHVGHIVTIPVCYSGEYAPDLPQVAIENGLTDPEVVSLHSNTRYRVYFMGFLPGFPYLGSLDTQLHTPRRSSPRPIVPKGSVGIGGSQTGIYPIDSPGGWNLIGRTPISLFDPEAENPTIVSMGDYVKFEPISLAEFQHIENLIEEGTFVLNKTTAHD